MLKLVSGKHNHVWLHTGVTHLELLFLILDKKLYITFVRKIYYFFRNYILLFS